MKPLCSGVIIFALGVALSRGADPVSGNKIGDERGLRFHLPEGEFQLPIEAVLQQGSLIFQTIWTWDDGGGRPVTKGNGLALSDASQPLTGFRAFNRVSAPDANSCYACHNMPAGISGGGGDFASSVFVLAQRFDFAQIGAAPSVSTKDATDERGRSVTLNDIGNLRASAGLFGAGYIEMLARQMTEQLQTIRSSIGPGESRRLIAKGVAFGALARTSDGLWDVSKVEGLPRLSLITNGVYDPPSLVIRPWHAAGAVVSLREFTNTAFNQHHGIQSTERFGLNSDPDGDGIVGELTRGDITAVSLFQAALAVPGRVIPNDPEIEAAVLKGESLFTKIGCVGCHLPSLPLEDKGWVYSEPNPFNPSGNLRVGEQPPVKLDLTDVRLPLPRLSPQAASGVLDVPAYTDLKLHDITSGPEDPNGEPLNMQFQPGTTSFFEGNRRFLTKRLWGAANEPPYFHHGLFTTLRQAILAHSGEALKSRLAFEQLTAYERSSVIEFLKTLQVLPPGTRDLIVDEQFKPKRWPPEQP